MNSDSVGWFILANLKHGSAFLSGSSSPWARQPGQSVVLSACSKGRSQHHAHCDQHPHPGIPQPRSDTCTAPARSRGTPAAEEHLYYRLKYICTLKEHEIIKYA